MDSSRWTVMKGSLLTEAVSTCALPGTDHIFNKINMIYWPHRAHILNYHSCYYLMCTVNRRNPMCKGAELTFLLCSFADTLLSHCYSFLQLFQAKQTSSTDWETTSDPLLLICSLLSWWDYSLEFNVRFSSMIFFPVLFLASEFV